jgi:hypothetical protein
MFGSGKTYFGQHSIQHLKVLLELEQDPYQVEDEEWKCAHNELNNLKKDNPEATQRILEAKTIVLDFRFLDFGPSLSLKYLLIRAILRKLLNLHKLDEVKRKGL